jgi:hypothetical protein
MVSKEESMTIVHKTATVFFVAFLAVSATAGQGQGRRHRTPRPEPSRTRDRDESPSVNDSTMIGTWVVADRSYRDVKAEFRSDGTFRFVGSAFSSTGLYHVRGHALCLEWTAIDGEAVERGTIRKDYEIFDDSSFAIDHFQYRKLAR